MKDISSVEYCDVDAFLLKDHWVGSTFWPKLHVMI